MHAMGDSQLAAETKASCDETMMHTEKPASKQELVKEPSEPLVPKSVAQLMQENEEAYAAVAEDYPRLTYFQSSLFASLLEDTITQFRILVECNNELRIIKTVTDMDKLLKKKFSVKISKSEDELEHIDPKKLACNEYKINKLEADRDYATEVITMTYINLSVNRSFKELKKYVNKIIALGEYRVALAEEEIKSKLFCRDLSKQLRQQRNHIKSTLYDTDVTISRLNTEVEDSRLYDATRSRYTGCWQQARSEQHSQTIDDTEHVHATQIEYFKRRTDHEQRVHAEVELLTNIMINETLQKIEDWMDKYDKDMEKLDVKIQVKKLAYYAARDKRINLEETIEKHDDIMKMWIKFKDEREKLRQYREKMTKSAIIVQAWWRGLLVRRQLGPYRVSKKKKGKKN